MSWRVPVLTYHAANVAGDDYARNDHVALREDLEMFAREGWHVLSLADVARARLGTRPADFPRRVVALSCDDGTALDAYALEWPGHGLQPGFRGLLDAAEDPGRGFWPTMTTFVIADPVARAKIDAACLFGRGWMDEWWREAQLEGRFDIGCHSWDHNHAVLDTPGPDGMPRGDFHSVDTEARARFEIDQAVGYLNSRLVAPCVLFAWPFGHAPAYVRDDYLPRHGARLGLLAAYGTQAGPVHAASPVWELPRYVCGWHWRSQTELRALLEN